MEGKNQHSSGGPREDKLNTGEETGTDTHRPKY